MVKETVTCEDIFTGEEKTVDLYFHLTEAELALLNLASNNKYANFDAENPQINIKENIELFEKLISKAYGKRTDDGGFIKNDKIRDEFLCSPEFSAFLTKFINGEIDVNKFVLGCLPRNISRQMEIKDGKPVIKQQK